MHHAFEHGIGQIRFVELGFLSIGIYEPGSNEGRSLGHRLLERRRGKIRIREVGTAHADKGEIGTFE
jgi:hypothetical protein